jgi:large subunit ribosomal protein L10
MKRDEKAATIEEIAAQIKGADSVFAIDYRGISVPQAAELRGKLREADASFRIVKNRLTKLAAKQAGEERLDDLLEGPTALTFVQGDTAMAAKAISTFSREHEVLVFKGGFMDELSLDEDRFKSIALLPSRDVLDGQLAGVVASPLTGLVRGLGSMISGLALQLGQIAEKGLVSGEAPADPSPAPATEDGDAGSSEEATESGPAEEEPEAGTEEEPEAGAKEPEADAASEEEPEAGTEEEPAGDGETSDSEDDASKEEE